MGEAQLTRARTKGRAKGRAGQAGRRQGTGRVGLQDSILRFSSNFGPGPGQGAGQGRRQGAGHSTKGKAGLQDSILRFSRPENPKLTVLQLFEERGRDRRAGHASLACPRSLGVFRVCGLRSYRLNLARLSSGASGR